MLNVECTPTARQGSKDTLTAWPKAQKNWIAQLLIQFGAMTSKQLERLKVDGDLPAYFDAAAKLMKLNFDQIAWF